jgi:hypothetical protein
MNTPCRHSRQKIATAPRYAIMPAESLLSSYSAATAATQSTIIAIQDEP